MHRSQRSPRSIPHTQTPVGRRSCRRRPREGSGATRDVCRATGRVVRSGRDRAAPHARDNQARRATGSGSAQSDPLPADTLAARGGGRGVQPPAAPRCGPNQDSTEPPRVDMVPGARGAELERSPRGAPGRRAPWPGARGAPSSAGAADAARGAHCSAVCAPQRAAAREQGGRMPARSGVVGAVVRRLGAVAVPAGPSARAAAGGAGADVAAADRLATARPDLAGRRAGARGAPRAATPIAALVAPVAPPGRAAPRCGDPSRADPVPVPAIESSEPVGLTPSRAPAPARPHPPR
jgi:hypothetical protein